MESVSIIDRDSYSDQSDSTVSVGEKTFPSTSADLSKMQ